MSSPADLNFTQKIVRLLFAELDRNGYTQKDIERITGKKPRTQDHYRSKSDFNTPTLTTVLSLIRHTKPVETMQYLADETDGLYMQMPEINDDDFSEVYLRVSRISKEFSEFVKSVADATSADGDGGSEITLHEVKRMRMELKDLLNEGHVTDKALEMLEQKLSKKG